MSFGYNDTLKIDKIFFIGTLQLRKRKKINISILSIFNTFLS